MEASNLGVNSAEFLNKKVERLKRALEEANQLMDRHVAERDEARAEAAKAQQEVAELKRRLRDGGAPAGDPGDAAPAGAEADELRGQLEAVQAELERTRGELESARSQLVDAESAATAAPAEPAIAASARKRPESVMDLTPGGPFVEVESIRRALVSDGFILFCQPVFSLQDDRVTQYELLLRMKDDQGRLVRPFAFLEPADRYGLMPEIDRWVVGRALELLTGDSSGQLRLEVNIAGQSIDDRDLAGIIEQHVAVSDIDPARLIIEVSENVAVAHLDATEKLAKRLRGLGVGFALDDFGSTFASFRHLRDLPVNFLKLDGDLVVTVIESRTGQLTIKSLVDLAQGIGAETIAEYVSDDQTLEFLRDAGVGYAQGYRIGRPRPLEEVIPVLEAGERKPAGSPRAAAPGADAAESR